jgi:hypothetical protein
MDEGCTRFIQRKSFFEVIKNFHRRGTEKKGQGLQDEQEFFLGLAILYILSPLSSPRLCISAVNIFLKMKIRPFKDCTFPGREYLANNNQPQTSLCILA